MDTDNNAAKSGRNDNSPSKKLEQLKNEKLASALRDNLRRRKLTSSSLKNADEDS